MYVFSVGNRVRLAACWHQVGTVESMVPGNGSIEWYYVSWDDGTSDRYTREELVGI